MIDNAAESTSRTDLARSSSSSPSDGSKKERLISRSETDNDDADGMRSILEAAIGLTSLNGAPARSPARSPLSESSAASSKGAVGVESTAAAAVAPSQERSETARKTTGAAVPPLKWQGATFRPPATSTGRHAPPSNYNDQLPVFNNGAMGGALSSLPPSRGIKITYPPPPLYYAPNDRGVASYPEKKRYPQFRYPDPPSTSSTSHFPSNAIRAGLHAGLSSKRHKIDTQSWMTTATPWRQHRTQREQGRPTDPTATVAEDTAGTDSSLNFPETLYDVVSDPANHDIISWLPHGRGFVVHDKQLFGSRILPCYFDGAKYTSFTRRLKRWKFERVPRGPEMGAYYNKFFVRDRPELVRAMLYGMEEGGEVGEDGKESKKDERSREVKKKKKKGEKSKQSEVVHASCLDDDHGDSRDDAVVEAAMEVRRQRQRQLTCDMDEKKAMGNDDIRGDESEKKPEKKTVKKQKKNGKSKSEEVTSVDVATAYDDSVVEAAMEVHRQKLQQQQQSKLIELQCSQESSGPNMQQPQYPKLPNEPLLASYLGYQGPTEPQRKRKRAEKGQRQPLTHGTSDPERLHQSGPDLYNHGDYLSMPMPHPHAAKMTVPHHNGSIADVSLSSSHWNAMLSQQHRNIISPSENKQQQCLHDIERQVLSDMSHPRLLKMPSSESLPFGSYPNSTSNDRRNYNSDMVNEVRSDVVSDQDTIASDNTTAESSFMNTLQATTHRGRANGDMMQRILSGSKTHKEVMMIAARGLQSRSSGRGYFTGLPQNHQQLPLHQLQHQQLLQQSQHPPMHGPMSPSRTQQQLEAAKPYSRTGYSTSHMMMLRELEKVGNEIAMMGSAVDPASASTGLQDQNYGVGLIHPTTRRNDRAFAA